MGRQALTAIVWAAACSAALAQAASAPAPSANTAAPAAAAPAPDAAMIRFQKSYVQVRDRGQALASILPPGSRMRMVAGKPTTILANGAKREPNAAEMAAWTPLVAAFEEQIRAQTEMTADFLPEERDRLVKARVGLLLMLEPGESAGAKAGGGWEIKRASGPPRAPTAEEAVYLAEVDAVAEAAGESAIAKLMEAAISQAPLRIVADKTQEGKTGQVKRYEPIVAQTMVFNRAAKLDADLVRKGKTVIPGGTTLFVTTENKKDYYCLPRAGFIGSQILCFDDSDSDGKLDHESNGGTPLNGVYMYADGFFDRGAVLTPAAASSIPYMEGHKQQAGLLWSYTSTDKATGAMTAHLSLAVGAGKTWTAVSNSGVDVKLDEKGVGTGKHMGAEVEVRQVDKNLLEYKIIKPMPEQPFGLEKKVTYYR